MKKIQTAAAPSAIGPYSQGIVLEKLLFTSGQLGIDVGSGELGRDVREQTRYALTNVQRVVEAAGGSLEQVAKVMVFLVDMDDFSQVNEVYASFFKEPYPARSCVQVARLPKDGLVEIEAVCRISED